MKFSKLMKESSQLTDASQRHDHNNVHVLTQREGRLFEAYLRMILARRSAIEGIFVWSGGVDLGCFCVVDEDGNVDINVDVDDDVGVAVDDNV